MKFKIIQRNDGKYDLFKKRDCFSAWKDTMCGPYTFYDEAKKQAIYMLRRHREYLEESHDRKHKRDIEIIKE